MAEDNQA